MAAGRAKKRGILGASLASMLLAGCAAVPNVGPRPALLTPDSVAAKQTFAGSADAVWPGEGWWRQYGDAQLDALIAEGFANSPDVAAAAARFRKAGAFAEQAGAARYPTLDVEGGVSLEKQSLNMGYPPQIQAFLPQGWNDSGRVSANLGFDLDLWGKNRAALAAATSETRAAAIDAQQARLALAVGIASAYFDLDRLFAERDIRARELEATQQQSKLFADRQSNGLETRGGVASADAAEARARLGLNEAEESLALRRNQIAALVGAGPDRGLAIARPTLALTSLRALPADLTTDLVGRRPDIAASRERVEAAASRIKVARADFFPAIRLSAMFGLQSLGLDLLFDKNSSYGSVGPAVSLPIFHGGQLQGQYRGVRADYDAAVASYNGTVLGAYQQTADALTTSRMVAQRLADAKAAQAASQVAFNEISLRYKGGLVTYLDVLQVEDRLLQSKITVIGLESAVRNADVALVRALGGGFASLPAAGMKDTTHG